MKIRNNSLKYFFLKLKLVLGPLVVLWLVMMLLQLAVMGVADPGGQPIIPDNSTSTGSG